MASLTLVILRHQAGYVKIDYLILSLVHNILPDILQKVLTVKRRETQQRHVWYCTDRQDELVGCSRNGRNRSSKYVYTTMCFSLQDSSTRVPICQYYCKQLRDRKIHQKFVLNKKTTDIGLDISLLVVQCHYYQALA